ncbi:MAG: nitroreductase family protein [Bacteroidales bacterium]|jgi:predicted oxidoreductase (fatty acid repression mutant protein)|nr:nitroreductase family protein [Bacteroidales bacterium]
MNTAQQAFEHRRSYYSISNTSPISDDKLIEILTSIIKNTPSGYNSQSTRMILLLDKSHLRFWEIVKGILKEKMAGRPFERTEKKINDFAAGYGTVLFFEDQDIVKSMQEKFPNYADNFTIWSQHTAAMHQYATWVLLEDTGFGASLQHYHPIIDDAVAKEWNIPNTWKLTAQMPFGTPTAEPGEKTFEPVEDRFKIFR